MKQARMFIMKAPVRENGVEAWDVWESWASDYNTALTPSKGEREGRLGGNMICYTV